MFAGRISIALKPELPAEGTKEIETVLIASANGLRSAVLSTVFRAALEA